MPNTKNVIFHVYRSYVFSLPPCLHVVFVGMDIDVSLAVVLLLTSVWQTVGRHNNNSDYFKNTLQLLAITDTTNKIKLKMKTLVFVNVRTFQP